MGIFEREPTIGNSNLTQSDLDRLLDLDDTYRTDYTYVTSKSYRLNGSDDYETPRMSRLPLNYYRRKWAFEKARKAGLLYYMYFCTCDFVNELMPRPLAMIFNTAITILHFIVRWLWYIINEIFPNPEHFAVTRRLHLESTPCLEQHKQSPREFEKSRGPSPMRSRETVWHSQMTSLNSLANRLKQSFTNMITLGYLSEGEDQSGARRRRRNLDHNDDYDEHKWHGYSSFNPVYGLTRNVQRRVRTSSYEYSEDRGPEVNKQSVPNVKLSRGFVESLFFKLFYLTFMAVLSPVKTFEFTTEKIIWILRHFSHSTYDLRSRIVYKNLSLEGTLPYTNRLANFLSEITTSCFLTFFFLIRKIVFLPLTMFSSIISRLLGPNRSNQSLQQQAVGTSPRHGHYLSFQIFHFLIDHLYSCATGFIFFFVSLQLLPFYIAESVRKRAAYALANIFGPRAALLVGYEEVRPVKRKGLTTDLDSPTAKGRQKVIDKVAFNKSQLLPTRGSVKCSSAFWKWLFPLLILLLLLIMFHKGHDARGDLMIGVAEPFDQIQQNSFSGWKQKIERGLNLVFRNVSYLLSVVFHFLYDLLLYPGKLYGAMVHPRESLEKLVQLPKYVYMAGQSVGTKAMANRCSYNFLCRIPRELYSFGELAIVHFFERVSILGSSVCGIIQRMSAVSEWIQIGLISENIVEMILFVWKLISSAIQILLALPSHFISTITQFMPFVNEKAINSKGIINSEGFNQQQAQWILERLRHEKELLELKVLQLRREREVEEDRYKNIHKALKIVEKGPAVSPDKRLKESLLVNDESSQHKNNQDFLNYMTNLRKSDDEELRKRLFSIERRLMGRLDTLSEKIENEIAQKIIRTSEQPNVRWSALSNELSELSSAVGDLRIQFDELRREKKAKIAQFAHSIMSRDIKQSDDLNVLKTELNKKIKDDLDKELSFSLNRFEKASLEEREAFRLEIMKAVENRVVALFASHVAEKSDTVSETKLSSVLGLSESDFTMIKRMITDALDTYDADKTGKVDYALESSGASVVSTRCTEPYKENSRVESIFGIPLWYSSYSPRAVIQHRPLAAGECWAFRGKGYLTIKLSHPIYVTEISYEHLHSNLHPDGVLKSAPKLFQVYSYKAVDDFKSKFLIGQYEYDIKGRALQTFHAQNELKTPVSIVELVVQSNWNSDYTCLYRFRVHGRKA
ncbi:UNC84A protein [Loa loa]|uniref:UNC84A protein n=1 Tax=Loa loa TaxID=7209 RepID=A0A1I7VEU9_LOALO|nr:UNC84A protein [Loa loa]EJD76557.1 UNC84A protein [Loa loa]